MSLIISSNSACKFSEYDALLTVDVLQRLTNIGNLFDSNQDASITLMGSCLLYFRMYYYGLTFLGS